MAHKNIYINITTVMTQNFNPNKYAHTSEEVLNQAITTLIQERALPMALVKSQEMIRLMPGNWQGYAFQAHILYIMDPRENFSTCIEILHKALYLALKEEKYGVLYRIYFEMAIIYRNRRMKTEALLYHRMAVEYFNKNDTAMMSQIFYAYAAVALLYGDYAAGFEYYRYAYIGRDTYLRGFSQPWWWGEERKGARLFIHNEQAYGDLFFFFRYIRYLKPLVGTIIIEAPQRLIRFLSSSKLLLRDPADPTSGRDPQFEFYVKQVGNNGITDHPVTVPFDYHLDMALLPRIHRTTYETVPVGDLPIFQAEKGLVEKYAKYFVQFSGKLKVAINWCGKHTNENEPERRLPYSEFVKLAKAHPRAQFFSIQKIYELDKIRTSEDGIINLGQHLDNGVDGFIDTAAVMSLVDLVISSDTGIVHVSGGLDVPTWILIPHMPEWRWGLEGEKSVWYSDKMRLFRNSGTEGGWEETFGRVSQALSKYSPRGEPHGSF